MNPRCQYVSEMHQHAAESLTAAVTQIDSVLRPWGFTFVPDGVRSSHCSPFASGHYCRGTTRIGLSCRDTIDNLFYEHSFIEDNPYSRAIERFTTGHDMLMSALGHAEDCRLVWTGQIPDTVVARDGGDRVAALVYDLSVIAAPVLREPCEEFYAIMRRGLRCYSVAQKDGV